MTIAQRVNNVLLIPLLFLLPLLAGAQNTVSVKGRVLNELNMPVAGATVALKEGRGGVTTDSSGYFFISVPRGATLVISYIGYAAKEVKARSGTMDILLQQGNKNLDEVVVIGY